MPEPMLDPPFLSDVEPADDLTFPVQATRRGRKRLYWNIVNTNTGGNCGVLFRADPAGGDPLVQYADPPRLDPQLYYISRFGRLPVAVARADAEALAGYVLDCRSFPPGPIAFPLKSSWVADDAGRFRLDPARLATLHPELFRRPGLFTRVATTVLTVTSTLGAESDGSWMHRLVGVNDPDGQAEAVEAIAARLWAFPAGPAVVLSVAPFVVAAYGAGLDAVQLLRLPDELATDWRPGGRMVGCVGYGVTADPSGDLEPGPRATGGWNDAWVVLADPLVADGERLEQVKAGIPAEQWERCRQLGEGRLADSVKPRDGRPWLSRVAVRDQRKGWYRRPGGYLG